MRPQPLERARFILLHEPTVADHIDSQDSHKTALSAFLGHVVSLPSENAVNAIVY
jgi:hypothetical protein